MSFNELREWANSHPVVFIVPLVLLIVLAIYAGVRKSGGPTPVSYDVKRYFYDEDTDTKVIRTDKDVAPLMGAKGHASVVRAIYMGVQGKPEETLVYLMKYTDEAKASLDEELRRKGYLDSLVIMGHEGGSLVRKPEPGSAWVSGTSAEGYAIINSYRAAHPGEVVRLCDP
jgi:hypothetical protein